MNISEQSIARRRKQLSLVALLTSVFGFFCSQVLAEEAKTAENPPNVLIVITDDESWLERSAYGWSNLPTPHFDRLAREGVLFTHAYSSAPSCAPARAAFLTGRNFWELEQGAFIQAWLPRKFPSFLRLLEREGYEVATTGKVWGPGIYPEEGYSPVAEHARYNNKGMRDYSGNFEYFLEHRKSDGPFCFWTGIFEPHAPWAPDNHIKLEREFGVALDEVKVPGFLPDTEGIRERRANFNYEICQTDEHLGRILDALEKHGELENTLLIFTGDNGSVMSVPRGKNTVYDWGVHVPMAIMWPRAIPPGRRIADFVNFPDLAPTILEASGVEVPASMTGRSLMNLLRSDESGKVDPRRDFVVTGLEWHGEFDPVTRAGRAIRTERYQYVVHFGSPPRMNLNPNAERPRDDFDEVVSKANVKELISAYPNYPDFRPFVPLLTETPPEEGLYDLKNDPWQMRNLAYDSRYSDIKEELKQRMLDYQMETGDPRATGEMEIFRWTRDFVQERKRMGYPD